jgi:hypothetical protein
MEIIGDDKKLRALYSEAKVADQSATPSFTSVWHRTQARSLKPRRAFNLSFALVTALLVLTLGSLAAWSIYSNRSRPSQQASTNDSAPTNPAPAEKKAVETPKDKEDVRTAGALPATGDDRTARRSVKPRVRRSVPQADQQLLASDKTAKETTIGTWQSPTVGLLSSPTDDLFKSIPQLNANTNQMKSSLPGSSNDKEK